MHFIEKLVTLMRHFDHDVIKLLGNVPSDKSLILIVHLDFFCRNEERFESFYLISSFNLLSLFYLISSFLTRKIVQYFHEH